MGITVMIILLFISVITLPAWLILIHDLHIETKKKKALAKRIDGFIIKMNSMGGYDV